MLLTKNRSSRDYESAFLTVVLTRQTMVGETLVSLLHNKACLHAFHSESIKDLARETEICQAAEIVLLDSTIVDFSLMDLQFEEIKRICWRAKIVVLADNENEVHGFDYIDAGACGVAMKNAKLGSLVNLLRLVRSGELYFLFNTEFSGKMNKDGSPRPWMDGLASAPLTPTQKAIFSLLSKGLSNVEIAAASGKAPQTVKMHISAILRKLGAGNRTEAVVLGLKRGIT